MPTYKITDAATGNVMRVTGDTPPDPEDIEELFGHAPSSGFGSKVAKAIGSAVSVVANKIDAFTGNPLHAGISGMQDAADQPDASLLDMPGAFVRGGVKGFGNNNAPSGKQIFERAGYSGKPTVFTPSFPISSAPGWVPQQGPQSFSIPSKAGALGFALDLATPVPGIGDIKMLGKTGATVAKMAAEKGADLADAVTKTEVASKALEGAKTRIKAGLDASGAGFKGLRESLAQRYGDKLAPDAPKYIQIAQRNGLDATKLHESVLFGPASSAAHVARAEAESALGAPLRQQHAEMNEAIQGAIQNDIQRIGGEVKNADGKVVKPVQVPATAQEAGDLIKAAYDSKVEKIMGNMDVTYGALARQAPKAKIPAEAMKKLNDHLDELEKYATDLGVDSFDETTTSQAKHLLETVQKVRNAGDSFPAVVRGMQGLGRTAFKVKTPVGTIPPDLNKLRSLYGQLSETVADGAAANFGEETAKKLRANNKTMSEMFGDKAIIPSLSDAGKSEDKLFRSLILQGDSKRINTLKKYMDPAQIQQIKAAALKVLLKEDKGFKTMRNRLNNKEDAFNALFNKGELDNMRDLIDLGERQGNAVLSTSGTGGSVAHQVATWGDLLRPDKWLNKAETAVDKRAAAKQKQALKKTIDPNPPGNPPGAGFAPRITLGAMIKGGPAFRKKGLQLWASEDKEDNQ